MDGGGSLFRDPQCFSCIVDMRADFSGLDITVQILGFSKNLSLTLVWQVKILVFKPAISLGLYLYYDERVKYSLSMREIPREEPKGFPEGSGYISP